MSPPASRHAQDELQRPPPAFALAERLRRDADRARVARAAALGRALAVVVLVALGCGDDDSGANDTASASGDAGVTQQQTGTNATGTTRADGGAQGGGAHDAGAGEQATASTGNGGDGGGADQGPDCAAGCVATLAADCAMGPASQQQCVDDCERLQTGSCGSAYLELMRCAAGEAVTCGSNGLPIISACDAEQGTFVACLNH